jgi:hypothetical protein
VDSLDMDVRTRGEPGALHYAKRRWPGLQRRYLYTAEPNWYPEEIDAAFQMNGNYAQQPYSVWLDEVNLLAD